MKVTNSGTMIPVTRIVSSAANKLLIFTFDPEDYGKRLIHLLFIMLNILLISVEGVHLRSFQRFGLNNN